VKILRKEGNIGMEMSGGVGNMVEEIKLIANRIYLISTC
jgi:hypothetical protein